MALDSYNKVLTRIDNAHAAFDDVVSKQEKRLFDHAVELIKKLDTDNEGYIKPNVANLKRIAEIRASLAKFANNKEYLAGVKELMKSFDDIYAAQRAYFSQVSNRQTPENKYKAMKQIAVNNVATGLSGAGLSANVTDKIADMLLRAVTSGAKYADLTSELHEYLVSNEKSEGALAKYAKTYATTALTQYAGQNNRLLTDDIGCEWFTYTGSEIETTREFCTLMLQKEYIHISEFEDIVKGRIEIDGEIHQCKIYEKTGLPCGMIEGTNAENLQVNVGGWNCRHQLVPIAREAVPENIRAKFEKQPDKPIEAEQDYENMTEWELWYEDNKSWLNGYGLRESNRTGVSLTQLYNKTLSQNELYRVMSDIEQQFETRADEFKDPYYKLQDLFYEVENAIRSGNYISRNGDLNTLLANIRGELIKYDWVYIKTDAQRRSGISQMKQLLKKYKQDFEDIKNPQINVPDALKPDAPYWTGRNVRLNPLLFKLAKKPIDVVIEKNIRCYCSGNKIHLSIGDRSDKSKWHQESVVYHESGHAIVNQRMLLNETKLIEMRARQRTAILKKVESDVPVRELNYDTWKYETKYVKKKVALAYKISKELDDLYSKVKSMSESECAAIYKGFSRDDIIEQICACQDTIMSLTPSYGWGHSKTYMSNDNLRKHEYVAHAFENALIGNHIFQIFMPEIYKEMVEYVNSLL